jgi:murein DD-endopeptidase MepM/ murein hydrolase activator NlpD
VVDGKGTGHDYVYMHLKRRGRPKRGQRVRTGERIGMVGQTGNSSGCHLHFEMWSKPGWYEGGDPMRSVTRRLKGWDRWS